jgi:hypothetical protein
MMNRTAKLVAAVAVAMLALPAAAGSWPPTPARKAPANMAQVRMAQADASEQAINGFIAEPGENVASPAPVRYFARQGKQSGYMPSVAQGRSDSRAARAGFEFVGGETGWQPTGHKFVWAGGRFAHSEECDHAIRVVKAPTPAEVDSSKRLSPGA